MPAGVIPLLRSWKIGQRRKSTSKRSRNRALKRVTASFCQRELLGRQQLDRIDLVDGALVFRVEGAQGFDFVVEQVDPVRQLAAHREQVDQASRAR